MKKILDKINNVYVKIFMINILIFTLIAIFSLIYDFYEPDFESISIIIGILPGIVLLFTILNLILSLKYKLAKLYLLVNTIVYDLVVCFLCIVIGIGSNYLIYENELKKEHGWTRAEATKSIKQQDEQDKQNDKLKKIVKKLYTNEDDNGEVILKNLHNNNILVGTLFTEKEKINLFLHEKIYMLNPNIGEYKRINIIDLDKQRICDVIDIKAEINNIRQKFNLSDKIIYVDTTIFNAENTDKRLIIFKWIDNDNEKMIKYTLDIKVDNNKLKLEEVKK